MNQISMIKQLTRKHKLRLVILSVVPLAMVSVVSAETVAKRLSCVAGNYTRMIELVYEGPDMSLPCMVRQQKQGQQADTLWRAQFQSSYCDEKIEGHRDKLSTAGFTCEWLPGDQQSVPNPDSLASQLAVYRSEPMAKRDLADVVSWTTISLGDFEKDIAQTSEGSLGIFEKQQKPTGVASVKSEGFSEYKPGKVQESNRGESPHTFLQQRFNNFNAFSETEMTRDDWIIYLSGKSLAGINALLINEPGLFEKYLQFERQNTDNIYSQLQLRIHHLAAIAESKQQQTSSISSLQDLRLE